MIRLAKEEDIPSISKIARQNREFIGFVMNVALIEAVKKESLYVYEKNNTVIGFVHYHKRLDGWSTLHEIAVAKEYHGIGIGKELLSIPPEPVRLKTTEDNINAIAMYEKYGFELKRKEQGKKRELLVFEKGGLDLELKENKSPRRRMR